MKYFGVSDKPQYLIGDEYLPMAKTYWGGGPLPDGAKIIGGYTDDHRAGALIELANGNWICGNVGSHTNVYKPKGRPKEIQGGKIRGRWRHILGRQTAYPWPRRAHHILYRSMQESGDPTRFAGKYTNPGYFPSNRNRFSSRHLG